MRSDGRFAPTAHLAKRELCCPRFVLFAFVVLILTMPWYDGGGTTWNDPRGDGADVYWPPLDSYSMHLPSYYWYQLCGAFFCMILGFWANGPAVSGRLYGRLALWHLLARLYGRAGRLTLQNGGFWPGQCTTGTPPTRTCRASPRCSRFES